MKNNDMFMLLFAWNPHATKTLPLHRSSTNTGTGNDEVGTRHNKRTFSLAGYLLGTSSLWNQLPRGRRENDPGAAFAEDSSLRLVPVH